MHKILVLTMLTALAASWPVGSASAQETMEGGGAYPSPSASPTADAPDNPQATQAVNETKNLAPMSSEQASQLAIPSPVPGSRDDAARLRVDETLDSGSGSVVGSILLIAIVAVIAGLLAIIARRRGYLRSRGSQIAVVVIVAIIAAIIWIGPGMFAVA